MLLDGVDEDPEPERGFLLISVALDQLRAGEPETALATSTEVAELGARYDEPDLAAIGRLGQGQALVATGRISEAMSRLDEAMLTVTTGEVSPGASGIVYCAVIGECEAVFDLRRARQWTSALNRWCDAQPGLVPYRGICLVHRAHVMQLNGEWADAVEEADNACSLLGGHPAEGEAYYRLGELHRCAAETTTQNAASGRPVDGWPICSRAWRCSGWPRAGSATRRSPSAMRSTV